MPSALFYIYHVEGNDFKNFLNIYSPPLNIPSSSTLSINYIKSGLVLTFTVLSIAEKVEKNFRKPSGSLPYVYAILYIYE